MSYATALETLGGAAWRYIRTEGSKWPRAQTRDEVSTIPLWEARDVLRTIKKRAVEIERYDIFEACQVAGAALDCRGKTSLIEGFNASLKAYPNVSDFIIALRTGAEAAVEQPKTAVEEPKSEEPPRPAIPRIGDMMRELNSLVIGQQTAKRVLCVALRNHAKRILLADPTIQKTNVLLVGPSGSGKTQLARGIAGFCGLPFVDFNTSELTSSGYHGEDISAIFERLLDEAGGDLEKAQNGIVFLDEMDKKKRNEGSAGADVGGSAVQFELLKILEGTKINIRKPGGGRGEQIAFDTKNVLFIAAGAFGGLNEILLRRLLDSASKGASIGFGAKVVNRDAIVDEVKAGGVEITGADLEAFGMAAELVGRCPQVARLEQLTVPQLGEVLTEPRDALVKQFQTLFALDNVDLVFTPDAINAIAEQAHGSSTGARYLRGAVENILRDTQVDLENYSERGINLCTVTRATVEKGEPPHLSAV